MSRDLTELVDAFLDQEGGVMQHLTELEELQRVYCETHNDVYGVKAPWYHADTVERAREDLAALQVLAEAVWAQEKAAQ